jgi:putative transcriptional regulator
MRGRSVAGLKDTFYRVLAILYRHCSDVAVIDYPDKIERRSLDVVARTRDGKILLLKIADDVEALPRSEINELKGLGAALGLPAGIIALKRSGRELAPYVMYEKSGVPVLTPESIEEYLRGEGGLYAYQTRDSIRAKIDGDAMRKAREELGLSLGDVASYVGVSRKMVYEYERGVSDPTLEKAERLASLLGEDVIEPLDPFERPPEEPSSRPPFDDEGEASLARRLELMGLRVFHAKKTAADLAAARRDTRIVIAYRHRREPLARLLEKVDNLLRLSRITYSKPVAVVENRREERELDSLKGLTILRRDRRVTLNEVLDKEAPDNR